ncbi:MAG: SDR family NAD(P)-dependent oxidoreductase, partial [Planctomycetes bacterium]|nr:SDR family NAD(P)-dependent oxidoreductase [Planctomycetota bacterium]
PIQFTRELLPTLLARDEAHILNVCSVGGLFARGKLAAYHVSKFGLVGFSSSLRAEYVARGLGVTALCPGYVRTNLFRAALSGRPSRPVRMPPRWLTTSPERLATHAIKAIRRNQGLAVVTPMGRGLWYLQRLSPRLVEWLGGLGRKGKKAGNRFQTVGAASAAPEHALGIRH